MKIIKNPLSKSIMKICIVSFFVLCVVLTLLNYFSYKVMLFERYESHLKNIITNTESKIDTDDLAECIRTGVKSEKYKQLQKDMDQCKDSTDLEFLYIIIPLNTEERDNILSVIEAMSKKEYEETPEDFLDLNTLSGDDYSPEVAKQYLDAYGKEDIVYFENVTVWGDDYTGVKTLFDSNGNKVAELCVDIKMEEIHSILLFHSLNTIVITLLAGLIISMAFMLWTQKKVVEPIETLEQSVSDYMENGLDSHDPDSLVIDMPDIHTGNEVESLAQKIVLMSEALCVTVKSMLSTKMELEQMSDIARKDELTHVGNKVSYRDYVDHLQRTIEDGSAEFGIVMADVNLLKKVNDTYGHVKGDIYLQTCCGILCDVYQHSPVFRIGGDEFVVILTNRDYANRNILMMKVKTRLLDSQNAPDAEPWTSASIALGMAVYTPDTDTQVQQVVHRADNEMYADKKRTHKNMDIR